MPAPDLARFDHLHAVAHPGLTRLDDLIAQVSQAGDGPIERLSQASVLAAELGQLSDNLLGHFVEEARRVGRPWSQIGAALGVSKQAVQQRFVAPDFTRFTERARRSVDNARGVAVRVGARAVGPEHLLVGFAEDPVGVAGRALAASGAPADRLLAALEKLAGTAAPGGLSGPPAEGVPLTARAGKVLGDLAPAEAGTLGHNYVGTEHVLLALLRAPDAAVGQLLSALSIAPHQVRERVLQIMSGVTPK